MRKHIRLLISAATLLLLAQACSKMASENAPNQGDAKVKFNGYTIADSSAIITYPNGLRIYKVLEGPGKYPRDGMNIRMNYHGLLEDGTVFDSSFQREETFEFKLGQTQVITGMAQAVKKMRFGTQAVVIVPPSLGYGDKKERPANIPPNSTLTFHIELLGSF